MAITPESAQQILAHIPEKYKINFEHAIKGNKLNLAGKEMNDSEFLQYAIPFLRTNPQITNLYIPRNNLTDESVIAIANLDTIDTLDVSSNKFGQKGIEAIAANQTITHLDISCNQLADFGAIALSKSRTLKFLDFNTNDATDIGAKEFANNESIETLILDYNLIGDEAVTAIAKNKTITNLRISTGLNNAKPIGDESAIALSQNKVLKKLNISANHITSRGVIALSKNALEELDISSNPTASQDFIDYPSIKLLTENRSLITLDISLVTSKNLNQDEKNLLLNSDQYRKTLYEKEKTAFLSAITLTDHKTNQHSDQEKKASLLFQYYIGMKQPSSVNDTGPTMLENRLTEDLLKHIFTFMKPKPLKVEV